VIFPHRVNPCWPSTSTRAATVRERVRECVRPVCDLPRPHGRLASGGRAERRIHDRKWFRRSRQARSGDPRSPRARSGRPRSAHQPAADAGGWWERFNTTRREIQSRRAKLQPASIRQKREDFPSRPLWFHHGPGQEARASLTSEGAPGHSEWRRSRSSSGLVAFSAIRQPLSDETPPTAREPAAGGRRIDCAATPARMSSANTLKFGGYVKLDAIHDTTRSLSSLRCASPVRHDRRS
jgi:hypothetical protein